jgi:hypothetical protein
MLRSQGVYTENIWSIVNVEYLGVIQRIKTDPIRVISITDLNFFSFSYINLRNRIFYWFYTGAP